MFLEHDLLSLIFFSSLGLRHVFDEEAEVESRREFSLRGGNSWAWFYGWVWLGMAWHEVAGGGCVHSIAPLSPLPDWHRSA